MIRETIPATCRPVDAEAYGTLLLREAEGTLPARTEDPEALLRWAKVTNKREEYRSSRPRCYRGGKPNAFLRFGAEDGPQDPAAPDRGAAREAQAEARETLAETLAGLRGIHRETFLALAAGISEGARDATEAAAARMGVSIPVARVRVSRLRGILRQGGE